MSKEKIYNNQLSKYCKLENNERIFVIDERILQESSVYNGSFWGARNKDRLAKAMLMHWEREIQNNKHRIGRDITTQDVISIKKAMESYQRIMGCISKGWGLQPVEIEKLDFLEELISIRDTSLFEHIEYKKKGYIKEKYCMSHIAECHVVTVIEGDEYFTIKEIYIPYSGIVIQIPTE
jgi:hypothetical protein